MSSSGAFGLINSAYVLPIVAAFALSFFLLWRIRGGIAKKRARIGWHSPGRYSEIAVPLLVISLLLFALLRPFAGWSEVTIRRGSSETFFLVDVSRSMLAQDQSPNRLEVAKRKLLDALKLQAQQHGNERFGLILFAGESYVYCPVTSDYEVLKSYIQNISVNLIRAQGSQIAAAVRLAAASFSDNRTLQSRIIVLSDGEDLEFNLNAVQDVLKTQHVQVSTIGLGSPEGAPISLGAGNLIKDAKGNVVVSKLREDNLRRLAEIGGGTYTRATLDERDLAVVLPRATQVSADGVISSTAQIGEFQAATTVRTYNEIGPWLALGTLMLVLVFAWRNPKALLALTLLIACTVPHSAWADTVSQKPENASEAAAAYEQGHFEDARQGFEAALERDPHDSPSWLALGHTRYRLKDYAGAQQAYKRAHETARSTHELFESEYNLGNAQFFEKDLEHALQQYERALSIKPDDEATRYNRDLAKRLLEEQNKKKKDKNQQQKPDQNKSKASPSPSPSSSPQDSKQDSQQQQQGQQGEPSPQPSGDPGASPQSSPDGSPSGEPSAQPSGSPTEQSAQAESSPSPDPSNGAEGDASASPSATASPSGAPSAESSASASASPQGAAATGEKSEEPPNDEQRDSHALLEAFSDAPVLLRKHIGRGESRSQQTW